MIYSEGNLFVEGLLFQFYSIFIFYFLKPSVFLTIENLIYLSCYKNNVVVSYIRAHQINSLDLFIQTYTLER